MNLTPQQQAYVPYAMGILAQSALSPEGRMERVINDLTILHKFDKVSAQSILVAAQREIEKTAASSPPTNGHSTSQEVAGAARPQAATFFGSIALPLIARGLKVCPAYPRAKQVHSQLAPKPLEMLSNDSAQIHTWGQLEPNANVIVYAEQHPGGVCFVDKDGAISLVEKYERETGKTFPRTLLVQSSIAENGTPKGHWYFLQTPRTIALEKNITEKDTAGLFSLRVKNYYVVSIGSIHPKTGQPYKTVDDVAIIPMPDDFLDWLLAQRVKETPATTTPSGERRLVPHGQMHSAIITEAGRLLKAGYDPGTIPDMLASWASVNLERPYDEAKVRKEAKDVANRYEQGEYTGLNLNQKPDGITTVIEVQEQEVVEVFDPNAAELRNAADMSLSVMSGNLGELCDNVLLAHFPVAYAWPALIAAAGVMVPKTEPMTSSGDSVILIQPNIITNSYTGLVGPVNSGKSQAILWATQALGLPEGFYSDVKAGSSEGLLGKIAKMRNANKLRENVLIDLDEWQHLFSKAGIENSSFISFLHTAFYKRHQNIVIGRGKEIEVDCSLSFIGGIVQDEFDVCFGASSMGGLHDRFTFGLCPDGFKFMYRPFETNWRERFIPVSVSVAPEVWEMVEGIRKELPNIGREAEVAVRAAVICASFDGTKILTAKDSEHMIRSMILEQSKIREQLQPNAGVTLDAQCANALVSWLARNAPDGKLVMERDVRHGLRKTLARLGPNALTYTTGALVKQGTIWYGAVPNMKPYKGRQPHAYRLMDASGFAGVVYK